MTRSISTALLTMVLTAGTALAEFSPNQQQYNAIENVSQVIAGSRKCDDWEINMKLVAAIQMRLGFSVNHPETFDYIDSRVTFHMNRIKDRTREDICGAIERLYGPNGSAVGGLAVRVK